MFIEAVDKASRVPVNLLVSLGAAIVATALAYGFGKLCEAIFKDWDR